MKKITIFILLSFFVGISQPVSAQVVDNLNDVAVWTFNRYSANLKHPESFQECEGTCTLWTFF